MVTVGMDYHITQGKEAEFEAVFGKVLQVMQGTAGHTVTRLFRDVSAPGSYLIVSEWNSREAFERFISSDQFRNVTNWGKSGILSAQPRHRVFGDEPQSPLNAPGCPMHR